MKIDPKEFTEWLQVRVVASGGVKELAKNSGVTVPTLYRLQRGGSPVMDTLKKLGVQLEVPKVSA